MSRRRRRITLTGQWIPRPVDMVESPAYRVLSLSGHRVLARIEIEHAHHGGKDNGRLPVTYGDFERYGIEYKSIAPALREVQALGFARITERGRPSKSDFGRQSHHFELTYIHSAYGDEPTHEWKQHKTLQEAKKVAKQARLDQDEKAVARSKSITSKKSDPQGGKIPRSGGKSPPTDRVRSGGKFPPTVPGGKRAYYLYFGRG